MDSKKYEQIPTLGHTKNYKHKMLKAVPKGLRVLITLRLRGNRQKIRSLTFENGATLPHINNFIVESNYCKSYSYYF